MVPLIQRGLSVVSRCSSWAVCSRDGAFSRLLCLHKTPRVIVDDRQPLRAISGGPTPALRHQRRTWFGASYQRRTWLRKRSSTDNGRSRRLPRRHAGTSSQELAATWRTLLLQWTATPRSSTRSRLSNVKTQVAAEALQRRMILLGRLMYTYKSAEMKFVICHFTSARRDAGTARLTGHVFVSLGHMI